LNIYLSSQVCLKNRLQKAKNMANVYSRGNKNEEKANIDQMLVKLEDDIRKLKIDFGIYFNGGLKRPPHEARGRIEAQIKRLADDRNLSYAQRYIYNNIVSRFNSYRDLWRRNFKTKGEIL
jgi:hypothetical protein